MKLSSSEPDIRTIVDRIERGDIDLQPDFQRQEVWATPKKKRLIDTVMRGWSIPPIHLVQVEGRKLEVLDGQQRLASIRDFLRGEFSIDGNITPQDAYISSLHGKFYSKLNEDDRRQIDQFPIKCFKITDYSPGEPSELFYRLNQPVMLTAGEQRNALYGPAREQLKKLVGRFEELGNSKSSIGFSNSRLAYDDVLARLLFFIESGNFGVKGTESRISERFRVQESFSTSTWSKAVSAIELFSASRQSAQHYRFNKASILSWLIFFSRFDFDNDKVVGAIQNYISVLDFAASTDFVEAAAAVFEDRASLRVTDVSSVVYRDFCLNYIYYYTVERQTPPRVSADIIEAIRDIYDDRDDLTFEAVLAETLNIDAWSASL